MPTVQPSREAMLTIWSVVWTAVGRRIFGIAVISSTAREHLHADHGGLEAEQAVQIGHHAGPIERFRLRGCCMLALSKTLRER